VAQPAECRTRGQCAQSHWTTQRPTLGDSRRLDGHDQFATGFPVGQARVWFAMSRDRLLPRAFSRVHKRFRTPHVSTSRRASSSLSCRRFRYCTLADLSNIGTLFAFVLVSFGAGTPRKQPERQRPFERRGSRYSVLSILSCIVLMVSLPVETWLRFFVWLVIDCHLHYLQPASQ